MINPILFLLCHMVGDYWLQSDWMALNKATSPTTKSWWPVIVHCLIYTTCFTLLTLSWKALLFIGVTHLIIDRFPVIVRRLIWFKNGFLSPKYDYPPFKYCSSTGYYDDSPYNKTSINHTDNAEENNKVYKASGKPRHFFITMWLYIISDNTVHLICNYIALTFLG